MVLFAKRVRAPKCAPKSASTSETPSDLAASRTHPKSSWQSACDKISCGIRGAHLDVGKARRAGSMAGTDHLLGLSLAAIGNPPQHPMVAIRDGRAGVPKLGGDA